ncbi:MAG: hypothetical protein E7596_07910 [Ruminococcaceae bacterium]|nr:hypothetical protein [Oscillospiraceae bacterium]
MRDYLNNFMIECDYLDSDREFLLEAFDKIQGNEEAKKEFERILGVYEGNIKCDYYKEILVPAQNAGKLVNVHMYTSGLLIFMCMTKHLKELYIERGISLDIYHNSVLDLRYKLEECKAVRGMIGSFVAWWFPGFFDLTRFALGRLQFEVVKFEHNYDKNGITLTPESKVINVHIPRTGTPMDKEGCDKAYAMAREFFKAEVGENCPFICHSWLLYPEHENILPKHTNVYRFFSEFDVFEWADNEGDDLWRLFDTEDRNPHRLPTNSSLRRNYVDHLLKGGRVGWGLGVRP